MGHIAMPDATQELLSERGKTHGDFNVHARITQQIKLVLRDTPNWPGMSRAAGVLDMLAHKIGRVLAGNPGPSRPLGRHGWYSTLQATCAS